MSEGGFLLIVRDHERQNRFAERIENGWDFTDVVLASNWRGDTLAIGFVSLDGLSFDTLCLVKKGRRVATYQHVIRFREFVDIEEPLLFDAIREHMDNRVVRFFNALVAGSGGWVTPGTWNELVRVIRALRPQIIQRLDGLENALRAAPRGFAAATYDILQQEKDAYNLALRLAGFTGVALSSVTTWRDYLAKQDQPSSFLETISSEQNGEPVHIYEDRAIDNDADIFGDWDRVGGYVTGERVFRQRDEVLSITNVNRTRVESTLGVDLLYYQHKYKSFVLVQYKRMKLEGFVFRYRPDDSYERELQRMKEFRTVYAPDHSSPAETWEYRLNPDAFYFKLHEGELFDPLEVELSKGMYIPLDYWSAFIDSPAALGVNNGINVSYDNIGRYLNNTDFIALVKSGWIGSRGTVTGVIENIVEPLIAAGRSVTIGIKAKMLNGGTNVGANEDLDE